jgi:hypothetical protein
VSVLTDHHELHRSQLPTPMIRCSCGESIPIDDWDQHLRELVDRPAARRGLPKARAALQETADRRPEGDR